MFKSTRHTKRSAPTGLPAHSLRAKPQTSGVSPRQRFGLPLAASLVAVTTLILFMATLVASNSLATQGGSSGDTITQISKFQNENANLQTELASLTAVSRIYNEARSRGYVEPDKVMYAAPASPVALKP